MFLNTADVNSFYQKKCDNNKKNLYLMTICSIVFSAYTGDFRGLLSYSQFKMFRVEDGSFI